MTLPSTSLPVISSIARWASASFSNSTVPMPLERPSALAGTSARMTGPNSRNKSFRSCQPMWYCKFHTTILRPRSDPRPPAGGRPPPPPSLPNPPPPAPLKQKIVMSQEKTKDATPVRTQAATNNPFTITAKTTTQQHTEPYDAGGPCPAHDRRAQRCCGRQAPSRSASQ
jgi:hypothetical protein